MNALFLHGFGADKLTWLGAMMALPEVAVTCPDLRGHGGQVAALGDGSLADLAMGALQSLEEDGPVWCVGHSLGGGVALWLAAHFPERIAGLTLLAPLGLGREIDMARLEAYPETESQAEMLGFLESLVVDPDLMKPEFATYALGQLNAAGGREALRKILGQLPGMIDELHALWPKVAGRDLEVTTFWGAADSVARPDMARIEALGDHVTLPDVGHVMHVEAAAQINAHLREKLVTG
ncbi:MAG: alpha/beta fold hydrolase [Silicimonas sp.]|nr:alpha/beta fold hydrolase [Silicimonas sp.]